MLNIRREDERSDAVVARTLSHDASSFPLALGCHSCPEFEQCGGLCVEASIFDCLDFCCGRPNVCNKVCPNSIDRFVTYKREALGFDLNNVPRAPDLEPAALAEIIPLIYHGSARARPFEEPFVALRLADIVNFPNASLRFSSPAELRSAFKISQDARLLLTGVDHDPRIEAWWKLGDRRRQMIKAIISLGVDIVTTPNFSVVLDSPRTDDLHAMKRIAITFGEFQEAGLKCALHTNGRTDRDFERWAEFVRDRREVSILAYEFITGPGTKGRTKKHLDGLEHIAKTANRELQIVVRGNPQVIPALRRSFSQVTYIDTTAFIKAHKRQSPNRLGNYSLEWLPTPTARNAPIDSLLAQNFEEQSAYLRSSFYTDVSPKAM